MARSVSQKTFQLECVFKQLGMLFALSPQPRFDLQCVLEREIAALLGRRIEFDDAIGFRERQSQYAADVANRLFSLERAKGDYLSDPLIAIPAAYVVKYFVAAFEAKIDINIRHRAAARVEPPFEQQLMFDGVDLGYPERIGNQATDY